LAKVADNEPIFVLRAQDISAPETILHWIIQNPAISEDKRAEAFACSEEMRRWHKRKSAD